MTFQRVPEQHTVMEDGASVDGFSEAGKPGGPLFPIYHFNATRLIRLVPENGTVLDLGCGSGRFLRYFLQGRPDVQAIAVDLSTNMLRSAKDALREASRPVHFIQAPFAKIDEHVRVAVDAVVCLSALHHSPTYECFVDSLRSVARLRDRCECAVWLFDLVRPEEASTVEMIPRAYELRSRMAVSDAFRQDWIDSLKAGWTLEEFGRALEDSALRLHSHSANYSQLHWTGAFPSGSQHLWAAAPAATLDQSRAESLAASLELPDELMNKLDGA